jgi:hypothetical protein
MVSPQRSNFGQVPYMDARSPHNDRLRQDFYSGQADKRIESKTMPYNNPLNKKNDGKKYLDDMLHN